MEQTDHQDGDAAGVQERAGPATRGSPGSRCLPLPFSSARGPFLPSFIYLSLMQAHIQVAPTRIALGGCQHSWASFFPFPDKSQGRTVVGPGCVTCTLGVVQSTEAKGGTLQARGNFCGRQVVKMREGKSQESRCSRKQKIRLGGQEGDFVAKVKKCFIVLL